MKPIDLDKTWQGIEGLRATLQARRDQKRSVAGTAQIFVEELRAAFPVFVLARVYFVLPARALPYAERALAEVRAGGVALADKDRVVCLLGTDGVQAEWRSRLDSKERLVMPTANGAHAAVCPLVARLVARLDDDFVDESEAGPVVTRKMLGAKNGMLYLADARAAVDERGRPVVASPSFVEKNGIRTIFGMGGAFTDDTYVVVMVFADRCFERLWVDRFPSLVSNLKMATMGAVTEGSIFSRKT